MGNAIAMHGPHLSTDRRVRHEAGKLT